VFIHTRINTNLQHKTACDKTNIKHSSRRDRMVVGFTTKLSKDKD
jgi:hypothetical protein